MKYSSLVTPNIVPMIVPDEEVQDIDSPSDWKIAEMKYRLMVQKVIKRDFEI